MEKSSGVPIQGSVLSRGDATSPYTVLDTDEIVEFLDAGVVTCTLKSGAQIHTTVMSGSRYAIGNGISIITYNGTFNVS